MPLTEQQLETIRSWIGASSETDMELEAAYLRLGSFDALIVEKLNSRISSLAEQPTSLSVPGLSISNGANLTAWQDLLKRFTANGGSGLDEDVIYEPGPSVSRLVRQDRR